MCKHPLLSRGMRLNPERQEMEVYCKKCGQRVEDNEQDMQPGCGYQSSPVPLVGSS